MTQNTEQNVRTRDEQIANAVRFARLENREIADFLSCYLEPFSREAEARGAEEQCRKDAKGCERWEFEEPEYHDQGMGCGLEDRGIHDRYQAMEYGWDQAVERCIERIPEELYTRPANVAALEAEIASLKEAEQLARADAEASKARVMVLEAENAVLQARKIGAAPEPVPYSDPIQTMSTEQLCQRLQVLRARWDELMDSDEEMGGGSPMESMDEEMQSLENEISRRAALTREGDHA